MFATALGMLAAASGLFAAGLLWRENIRKRAGQALQEALDANHQAMPSPVPTGLVRRLLAWLEDFGKRLDGTRLQQALLAPEDRILLDQTGWNTSAGAAAYLGLRLALALLALFAALATLRPEGASGLLVLVGALAAGILLPKLALRAWAGRLRKRAHDELPLLIDMLRLLQGVGMSMDQSLQMLGEKLGTVLPVLGRELRDANTAYMRGRTREQSLRRLSESYDDEDLRSLAQIIVQVSQHGGAVQEPMRQFSLRLREQRRMEMKEKVGKLSVKMTVVMMLTLLPALMLVLAGPALVALSGTLGKLGG
ncbi:type II secretion system F family protein [Pseudoxanthomonas broegbernensis]|nr:type II secretion system F family protein [Pseudoxanthomonas broegbernensis]MBB6064425.1 tight adherence protein C [Pseudoxanthomonas broegbernensis]